MRFLRFALPPLSLAVLFTCALSAQQSARAKDEAAIRSADAAWSQAAETKDLEKLLSFYAEDATVLPFNAPIAQSKDQIRQLWSNLISSPGFHLHFAPTKIDFSRNADMAYEIGTFELKMNDAQGSPTTTPGKYVVVWKKQGNRWKAAADIFNTDK